MKNKEKIEYKGIFQRIWNDPVLSQIISVSIIFIITIVYSLIQALFKDISIIQAIMDTLRIKVTLFKILIFLIIAIVGFFVFYKWRQRKSKRIGRFDVEQRIGNFSFRELYNALITYKMEAPASHGQETKYDLLTLFLLYQRQFNRGVEWQHDHYTYYNLGPTLMAYGLTEKVITTNKLDQVGSDMIQTSKIGYEFYSLLERWRVYNDEILKEDYSKFESDPKKNKAQ